MEQKLVYNIEENKALKLLIMKFKRLNNLDWVPNLDELEKKLNYELVKLENKLKQEYKSS